MKASSSVRKLALLTTSVVLIGCQGGAAGSPSPTITSQGTSSPSEAAEIQPETTSVVAPLTSIGLSTVGIMSMYETLNGMGWKIETPETAGDILLQGVGSGQFDVGSGATFGAMLAAQKGAPIRLMGNRVRNEWTLYAKREIADCAALNGVRLGINSEASPATFMVRAWIRENCDGTEPEYLIVPGSENRFAALLVDQLDASPVELPDAMALEAEASDRFHELTSFSETLPDLMPTAVYINTDFANENPNTVTLMLKALVEEHRRFKDDPAYFKAQLLKFVPSYQENDLTDVIVDRYMEMEMFPPNGGMEPETMEFTHQFALLAQGVAPGSSVDDFFDPSYMERALELLDE